MREEIKMLEDYVDVSVLGGNVFVRKFFELVVGEWVVFVVYMLIIDLDFFDFEGF